MKNLFVLVVLCMFNIIGVLRAEAGGEAVFIDKPSKFELFGYLVVGVAWTFRDEKTIYVCWENPTKENEQARIWSEDQIGKTWEAESALSFKGWKKCAEENDGIRILYEDSGPHVKAFGKEIDGIPNGMVLNHTFEKWNPACPFDRETCVRTIAVHEFGHALGFAHEQNRPDTPGECALEHGQDQPDEKLITPYDKYSVMNYCNDKNNDGTLSELDIKGVRAVYGKPSRP